MTICAAKKGGLNEKAAVQWRSKKVAEGYTRFLLVVLSALKQIKAQDEPVLSDMDEEGFDRVFQTKYALFLRSFQRDCVTDLLLQHSHPRNSRCEHQCHPGRAF